MICKMKIMNWPFAIKCICKRLRSYRISQTAADSHVVRSRGPRGCIKFEKYQKEIRTALMNNTK